ncbi:MAG: hypothetical protein OEW79_14455 [Betaproteobacteria bacterium]|nr:hypothetical protein [Betaproteobacteria bacterium]MDH5344020.1 hypothetical protein [Betaproteobacteria bacterium]
MTDPGAPLAAIERLPLAVAMRHDLWLYPIVEIFHIVGFVTLVGSIIVLDLRLLGLSKALPVQVLARHVLPWSMGALIVIVPSGLLMFTAHAGDLISNTAFITKMSLLFCAGINAALFHAGTYRNVAAWDRETAIPPAAKLHAAASLLIWVGVLACGRLLAYV